VAGKGGVRAGVRRVTAVLLLVGGLDDVGVISEELGPRPGEAVNEGGEVGVGPVFIDPDDFEDGEVVLGRNTSGGPPTWVGWENREAML
jgi:hypothetical protein